MSDASARGLALANRALAEAVAAFDARRGRQSTVPSPAIVEAARGLLADFEVDEATRQAADEILDHVGAVQRRN